MHSPFLQAIPGAAWDDMCRRLLPLLGDIKAALGAQWHEKAEALFTEADFIVSGAIQRKSPPPDWFLIRFAPAGHHLDDEGDGLVCASSWLEAVAVVLGACESNRCLPSRVEYDEVQRILRLFAGEDLLATVGPLIAEPTRPELRQRARSTICGLRNSGDPSAELFKRVRRWPGLTAVVKGDGRDRHEMQDLRERMAHHPIPSEWLLSARLLCAMCGKPDPSSAEVQAVATAALGAQSWNHLAAPYGDFSSSMLQPWYLYQDDAVCSFHVDAIDAVANLLAKSPRKWIADWAGVELDSRYGITAPDYVPTYTLSELPLDSTAVLTNTRLVAAFPVTRAQTPADPLVERVGSLACRSSEDIAALFGVGLPVDVKARMLDERSSEILIVQDGQWRFTRTGDPMDKGTTLWAYRVGSDGNCVGCAGVPTYKGLLQTHRETGLHVLCSDYDGAHPVMVIDSLSPLAVAQVRANLPDTTDEGIEFREERRRPDDRKDFRKLLERALSRRSTV
jgi:hypothetical protein